MTVSPTSLTGGSIQNIDIEPTDPYLNSETSYTFNFTLSSSIDYRTESKIEIQMPDSIRFVGSYCSIEARSSTFSNSMSCNVIASDLFQLTYTFSNRDYKSGTPLSVRVSRI